MEHFFRAIAILVLRIGASECRQGYYPNVPLQDLTETPEFTQPSVLFVYNWPLEEQAICAGTVTAIDYCYQMSRGQGNRTIFTLLLLDSTYRIIQTINVTNGTAPDNCRNRGGVVTCCNRQQLRPEQQFQVPGSSVAAFGMFSQTGVDTILAFRDSSTVGNVTGYKLAAQTTTLIANNQISVHQNEETIHYRMFNFVITDTSSTAPAGASGIDSVAELMTTSTELTTSTESTTKMADNSETKHLPDMTSESQPAVPHPPPREGPVDIILVIEIVIGCIVVLLFSATIAMWIYLCFKARTVQQRQSKTGINFVTMDRNSQLIYELIPKVVAGPMVPPNCIARVQCAREEQQGQRALFKPPNIRYNTEVTEFVHNPAYRSSNLRHTGQLETAVDMEQNPSYCSSQERLFSN